MFYEWANIIYSNWENHSVELKFIWELQTIFHGMKIEFILFSMKQYTQTHIYYMHENAYSWFEMDWYWIELRRLKHGMCVCSLRRHKMKFILMSQSHWILFSYKTTYFSTWSGKHVYIRNTSTSSTDSQHHNIIFRFVWQIRVLFFRCWLLLL